MIRAKRSRRGAVLPGRYSPASRTQACAAPLQTVVEENEQHQGVTDGRGMRALRSTAARQTDVAAELHRAQQTARANLQTAALLYVRCLQQLLQDQCRVLEQQFGVNPQVEAMARQMWLTLLPMCGILEPDLHK